MIDYESVCKKLDALMVELLEKGFSVPQHVYGDIKSARSLISMYLSQPQELGAAMEASPFLQSAEMNLLSIAEAGIGKDFADKWQGEIIAAYQEKAAGAMKPGGFIAGIPKGEYWVRLKAPDITIDEELAGLLVTLKLTSKPQGDGYLLIYGKKENVKDFLKKVRQKEGMHEQNG